MLLISQILVPYDFSSCARQALRQASALARLHDAKLHILHIEVLHEVSPIAGSPFKKAEQLGRRIAEEHAEELAMLSDLSIHYASTQNIAAAPSILQYAKQYNIDIIIAGTHGRRGIGRIFLGSVAEELVAKSACPVLITGASKATSTFGELKNILAPVDFSEHAKESLAYARAIGANTAANLHLFHVLPINSSSVYTDIGGLAPVYPQQDLRKRALAQLHKLMDHGTPYQGEIKYALSQGLIASETLRYAREIQADMIVIGSHGLTGIKRFMLGSVAAKVIRSAQCPVFVVKSFGKSIRSTNASEHPPIEVSS